MSRYRALAVLLVALALAACSSRPPPPDPNALTVGTYTDFLDQVQAALPAWQQAHPEVRVQVVSLGASDFVAAITPRLASGAGADACGRPTAPPAISIAWSTSPPGA